jgi:hypothetical protein
VTAAETLPKSGNILVHYNKSIKIEQGSKYLDEGSVLECFFTSAAVAT